MAIRDELNVVQSEINGVVSALTYGYFSHMNKAGVSSISVSGESSSISTSNIGNTTNSSNKMKIVAHGYQAVYGSKLESDDTVCDPKNIPSISMMKDKNGYTQYGANADLFIDYSIVDNGKVNSMEWTCNKIDKYINPLRCIEYVSFGYYVALTSLINRYWYSVCYGNDKFVAVAEGGYFAYSTDGINWTEGSISSTNRYWRSVCYGNNKFVAVSDSNYFAYSTDGIHWTEGTISDTSRYWWSVCYGNDKFVAVANNSNYYAYSTDGINWTEGTISNISRWWRSVCYGNDKFVAVAGNNTNYFAYSTDGIHWIEGTISSTSRDWNSICYGNGKFVAVAFGGYFAYSTDGITWTEGTISSTSRSWQSVCYGNDKFVAVANNKSIDFAYSTDGITWTEGTSSSTSRNWQSVCYGNNKFVAVAFGGYFAYSTDGTAWIEGINQYHNFAYSTNGINWIEDNNNINNRIWRPICNGDGKYVTVAYDDNYYVYSTDGIHWTEGTISDTSRYWNSVCYGNGKFVAVSGNFGYSSNVNGKYFAYSTDGIHWTEGTISSTSRNWNSICYGNNKFVAVAESTNYFAYSTDGINWTEGTISSTSRSWQSVCYGNDKFITVAGKGYFAYSTDGINWTEGTISDTNRWWQSVCYGNNIFVAVDDENYFAYSIDGITWTEGTISESYSFGNIIFCNNEFISIASDSNRISKYIVVMYPNNSSFQYNLTNLLNNYISPSYLFNYQTKEISASDVMMCNSNLSNSKVKMLSSNSRYLNQYLEIPNYSSNISTDLITASQVLKDAINNGTVKFISNKFDNSSSWSDYNNEQFYKYLVFNDESYNYYLAITSDLMSFTTYKIPTSNYSFTVMNGVLFIYLPNKDSIAMITRHPNTTDVIEIDGNDPENMTDYTKPYYRLIEIPFLKKYYKYSGKHVQNVAIGALGTLSNDTTLFGNYKYPADCTLLINVFNKVYRIGVPMFNANNIKACNTKRLQEFYTSDEQTTENLNNMTPISQILSKYDSSDTAISCNINHRHFDINTDSNINITIDQMNIGYDSDIDETAPTTNKHLSNYTYVGANSLTDLSNPTFVLYPNAIY